MSRLFILCGLSFSGKTTVARAIADRLGSAVVSLDEINRERALVPGGEGLPPEVWAETHHLALARLEALMDDGRDLVVDDTCCFRFLRDDYRRLAASHDYRAVLVVVDTPLEVILSRRTRNAATGERGEIRNDVFEAHVASFEWPRDDEEPVVLRGTGDLESWLAALDGED